MNPKPLPAMRSLPKQLAPVFRENPLLPRFLRSRGVNRMTGLSAYLRPLTIAPSPEVLPVSRWLARSRGSQEPSVGAQASGSHQSFRTAEEPEEGEIIEDVGHT